MKLMLLSDRDLDAKSYDSDSQRKKRDNTQQRAEHRYNLSYKFFSWGICTPVEGGHYSETEDDVYDYYLT